MKKVATSALMAVDAAAQAVVVGLNEAGSKVDSLASLGFVAQKAIDIAANTLENVATAPLKGLRVVLVSAQRALDVAETMVGQTC